MRKARITDPNLARYRLECCEGKGGGGGYFEGRPSYKILAAATKNECDYGCSDKGWWLRFERTHTHTHTHGPTRSRAGWATEAEGEGETISFRVAPARRAGWKRAREHGRGRRVGGGKTERGMSATGGEREKERERERERERDRERERKRA